MNGGIDENGRIIKNWVPTANYLKKKEKLSRTHHRIKKIREDFIDKITTEIIDNYDVICVEGLKIKNMTRRKVGIGKRGRGANRAMLDQGWGEFIRKLKYKAEWSGKIVLVVDTFFPSTKMCSRCGNVKENIKLTERTYRCDKCGLEIDRDLNASHNLMTVAAGLTETLNTCGDESAGQILQTTVHGHDVAVEVCIPGGTITVKQEPGIPEVAT
jgi:IS605 OrfB family transposase